MDGFWNRMDELGVDRNPYRAGFAQQICVSETDESGGEGVPGALLVLLQQVPAHPALLLRGAGYRTRKSTEFAIRTNQPGVIAASAALEKNWKTSMRRGSSSRAVRPPWRTN